MRIQSLKEDRLVRGICQTGRTVTSELGVFDMSMVAGLVETVVLQGIIRILPRGALVLYLATRFTEVLVIRDAIGAMIPILVSQKGIQLVNLIGDISPESRAHIASPSSFLHTKKAEIHLRHGILQLSSVCRGYVEVWY